MQLMPDTGALAITDGSMVTDMDSLEAGVKQIWGLPFLSGLNVSWGIDVLSPDAAVLTTEGSTVLDSAGKSSSRCDTSGPGCGRIAMAAEWLSSNMRQPFQKTRRNRRPLCGSG